MLRSSNEAVAPHLVTNEQQEKKCVGEAGSPQQEDLLLNIPYLTTEHNEGLRRPSALPWWLRLASGLGRHHHIYDPLSHPAVYGFEEEAEEETPEGGSGCCTARRRTKELEMQETTTQEASNDEVVIGTDLLQIGDVVRVAPQDVIPADGVLLVRDCPRFHTKCFIWL